MTDIARYPNEADLENLFINNPDFDRLAAYLNRFNPIRIMRTEAREIQHSNILGWLLDPLGNHGLGDRFLRAFLTEALKGESAKGHPTALEIAQADLRDIEVRREWQNIDLFLLSRLNNWAFIIENKFLSRQHEGQLATYLKSVRTAFEPEEGQLDIRGIFLTLHKENPEDNSYSQISYFNICNILTSVMELEGKSLGKEVVSFLNHYINILKEAAGMSEDQIKMEGIARDIYRQHRKVLNFIWRYGSGTSFSLARDDVFGGNWINGQEVRIGESNFVSLQGGEEKFSFLPLSWYDALGKGEYNWPGCENWWSGLPLICWMQVAKRDEGDGGSVSLFAEVGPLSHSEGRNKLIELIKDVAKDSKLKNIQFGKKATEEDSKFSRFFKNNKIEIKDIHDEEEISKAIKNLLQKFQEYFDNISPSLNNFMIYARGSGIILMESDINSASQSS